MTLVTERRAKAGWRPETERAGPKGQTAMPRLDGSVPRAKQQAFEPNQLPLFLRGSSSTAAGTPSAHADRANGSGATRFDALQARIGHGGVLRVLRSGLFDGDLEVGRADDPLEGAAETASDSTLAKHESVSARQPSMRALASPVHARRAIDRGPSLFSDPGQPLPLSVRSAQGSALDHDFEDVRVHTGPEASDLATALGTRAFTLGRHIGFRAGAFAPQTAGGRRRLAHELTHVSQVSRGLGRSSVIRRETPEEVIERFTDWGGLNLQEEELGAYLSGQLAAGNYAFVGTVIQALSSTDRDDVAGEALTRLTTWQIIRVARDPAGLEVLRLMRDEIGGGWVTRGENDQLDLIGAVLDQPGLRVAYNRRRILAMKGTSPSDLESLARLFADDEIVDDGTVNGRLQAILDATEHAVIPGLQTGVEFSDTGFAGTEAPGGPGFRDPHPSSRNQVGHFLTAVGLEFSPAVVSTPIVGLDLARAVLHDPGPITIRDMVNAPAGMSDADVATRLTIGHEKAPDPSAAVAALNIVITGFVESLSAGPEGETEDQRDDRVGLAVMGETRRQMNAIIAAFRSQFVAASDDDVRAWNDALTALGPGVDPDLASAEPALAQVHIDISSPSPDNRGNSIQDLRLSLIGWRLGQLLQGGRFADRYAVADWLRRNLGPGPS